MQEKAIIASTLLLCFSSNDCLPLENLLGVNRLLSSSASCLVYPEALSIVDNFEERNYLASIYFEQFSNASNFRNRSLSLLIFFSS